MKRFYEKLKRQAMENPLLTVAIATAAVTAAAKLLEASTQHKYAITHEREVDRRIAMMQYK